MSVLNTPHGALQLPAFLPDGTRGVVRTVDGEDLTSTGIRAVMVNSLHLGETPGMDTVRAIGGIHRFMGWDGPVASDSGGFQAYSLPANLASVSDEGFSYRLKPEAKKRLLSAERCVRQQLRLGSDVIFCLDECTHPDAPADTQRTSVERTLRWSKTGLETARRAGTEALVFGVVQGGNDPDLRRRCAEGLLELGFDGYGYGGWPIDDDGKLVEMVALVASLLPPEAPKHALGIGRPENVVAAFRAGWTMFDCTLPTRNARRGALYVFTGDAIDTDGAFYRHLWLEQERYRRDARPVEDGCDCATCTRFTRAYLSHLLTIGDPLGLRLATMHNLRFYSRLMEKLGG